MAASKKTICGAFSAMSLAVLAGVCLTLALQASAAGARASALSNVVQGSGPMKAGAQQCVPDWQVVSSPNIGYDNHLYSVSALSPGSAWAVGYWGTTTMDRTLTQHWDGTRWTIVDSPNPSSSFNHFYGVAAVSTNDVWAVGSSRIASHYQTLIQHWDGTRWQTVPSPNPGTAGNYLLGVAAVSANDVWAVGYFVHTLTGSRTLVVHWDGSAWKVVASPNPGPASNSLSAIAASSATGVWAVGTYATLDGTNRTLVERWDGSGWVVVPSPNLAQQDNFLNGVAAVSADDIWAVGYNGRPGAQKTLTEHWNGSDWSIVPTSNPGTSAHFNSVTAASSTDVWAVGNYVQGQATETLIEHWTGSGWTIDQSGNAGDRNELRGIATTPGGPLWSVGEYQHYSYGVPSTLIETQSDTSACPPVTAGLTRTSLIR